jgi:hypothetical protein
MLSATNAVIEKSRERKYREEHDKDNSLVAFQELPPTTQ